MGTKETREVVEAYYAALGKGDRAKLLELLDPDVSWIPPSTAPFEPIRGAEPLAEALGRTVVKTMFDISKPFNLEVRRMVVEDDVAVVQQRLQATAKATGKPYDNQYCWIYTVRDGRIVEMEEYADTLVAARTMGWDLQAES